MVTSSSVAENPPPPFRCHNFGRGSRFPNISFNSFHPAPTVPRLLNAHVSFFISSRQNPDLHHCEIISNAWKLPDVKNVNKCELLCQFKIHVTSIWALPFLDALASLKPILFIESVSNFFGDCR